MPKNNPDTCCIRRSSYGAYPIFEIAVPSYKVSVKLIGSLNN